ncbi:hypothetical protein ACHAW6_000462, partial [Cyclotella cf. meneghiniana]
MTKLRTRDKGKKRSIFVASKPGEVVSVDTMQSNELGFIAQAKEKFTVHCYKYATIFLDHFSRVQFIHLHRSNRSAKIVQAKQAFKRFADDHGVNFKQYHCDNGQFADKGFIAACEAKNQCDDFFETTRLSGEDVVTTAPWHVLAGFKRADGSKVESNVHVAVGNREPPVGTIDSVQPPHDFDDPFEPSQAVEDVMDHASNPSLAQASGGALPSMGDSRRADVSSRGCIRRMSSAMADSVSQ